MQKPEISFESGTLTVKFQAQADFDKDGKPSAELESVLKLHAAEVVSEIAKKDMAWLETLIASIKV